MVPLAFRPVRIVGLTGGIGSGKSTVAGLLRDRGAVIIDADALAKEVVAAGTPGLAEVLARFGQDVLLPDGTLDRKGLGARVFGDPAALRDLNQIIHPKVATAFGERIAEAERSGAQVCVYDVPLLYENGLDRGLPEVIVVRVSPAVQRARVAARDGLPPEQIEQRIAAQLPLEEKARRAKWVVDNDGDRQKTGEQVARIWAELVGDRR